MHRDEDWAMVRTGVRTAMMWTRVRTRAGVNTGWVELELAGVRDWGNHFDYPDR
jgi:hypothetical protein